MVHAVCSGARIPSGEDRGQIKVVLSDAVQHVASGHVLEGCLEAKGEQDSGLTETETETETEPETETETETNY